MYNNFDFIHTGATELPKYYRRLQTAVTGGLRSPAGCVILTLLPNTHSAISVQFPNSWLCTSTYICKAETLAFPNCDYC